MRNRGGITARIRRAGGAVKRRVLRAVGRQDPLERNAAWVRRVSTFVQKQILSEITFCPNGEVFEKDGSGAEFLVPVGLTGRFKISVRATEVAEARLLTVNTPAGGVVLDIGANVGVLSIRTALAVPTATLYAFEPVAANEEVLRKNIARNRLDGRVIPLRYAVGERDDMACVTAGYGTGNHLSPEDPHSEQDVERVPIISVDSFVERNGLSSVAAIKCDVEGYELYAMRGAAKILRSFRPVVLVELYEPWARRFGYHPVEVVEFLQRLDYQYVCVGRSQAVLPSSGDARKDLEAGHDFFFFPAEARERVQWT